MTLAQKIIDKRIEDVILQRRLRKARKLKKIFRRL